MSFSKPPPETAGRDELLNAFRGTFGKSRADRRLHINAAGMLIGFDEHNRAMRIPFSMTEGIQILMPGASGSGKTTTLGGMTQGGILCDMPTVVIDPKGDPKLLEVVRRSAERAERRLIVWTPDGSTVYNPYEYGADTEIADKLLSGERFTEPHYLRQAQRFLGHEVRVLRAAKIRVSLPVVVEYFDKTKLLEVLQGLPDSATKTASYSYLDTLEPRQETGLTGVRDRLATISESDVGCWLDPRTPGADCFDLSDAVKHRDVVYFRLDSDTRPLLSLMLGGAIVQDINTMVARLQAHVREGEQPVPVMVVIDECGAVGADLSRISARGRSADVTLVAAMQEISVDLASYDGQLQRLLANSTLVAHRQRVPESAELISAVAGEEEIEKVMRDNNGRVMSHIEDYPRVHPDQVQGLLRGRAVVVPAEGRDRVRIVRMLSPEEIASLIYAT